MAETSRKNSDDLLQRSFELHVICNSHLDREWTENYQFTRLLTVKFLDSLLAVMEQVPEYQFLLDSQTVPLEDYLEIRPEAEPILRRYVREQRLWVGPWYTAPDFSCLFGESIVRNLLIGHQLARDFGHVMKVGYTPFGFGQVSQLPQIYAGFGIDTIWFYRGVSEREVPGVCFRWVGADGTEAFCSRAARYNFYFGVMRPVSKGGGVKERDYDYSSTQLPIHFCDEARSREHAILADSQSRDALNEVGARVVELLRDNVHYFPGSVISFMNGMDTSMPTVLDDQVLQRARDEIPSRWRIFHSNLPAFVEAFRGEVQDQAIPTVRGERRDAGDPSPTTTMLGDVITARPEQKRRNAEAEIRLQRYAEPLATLAWLMGEAYPQTLLRRAWKDLCKCHAHDTIAGTGVDALEEDLLNRLDQVIHASEALMQFAIGDIIRHIDNGKLDPSDIPLVMFNPSPWPRSEVLTATIDVPDVFEYEGLELIDAETGQPVEFAITAWRPGGERVVRDLRDAPTSFYCAHVDVDFVADDIPPLGYRTFVVRRAARKGYHQSLLTGPATMENDHLRVTVQPDGTFDVLDKQMGRFFEGLNEFRDRAEVGNAWTAAPPTQDSVVTSRGAGARITIEHDSPLRACLKVEQVMRIPAGVVANDDYSFTRRSAETVDMPIASYLTLTRRSRAVDVRTVIENPAKYHTLQVLFPTDVETAVSASDTAFDVVERGIERDDAHSYAQVIAPTHPWLRFVDVSDGQTGLAIAGVGIRGYQVTEDRHRAIALTLLRAFEVCMCTVSYRWERRPDQERSQALGRHEVRYCVVPHAGTWTGAVVREAERMNCPLLTVQAGRHGGTLPPTLSLLEVTPHDVELSAIKKAEDRETLIVRLCNPTDQPHETTLTLFKAIKTARLVTLEEEPIDGGDLTPDGGRVRFPIGPKKIVTVELSCP